MREKPVVRVKKWLCLRCVFWVSGILIMFGILRWGTSKALFFKVNLPVKMQFDVITLLFNLNLFSTLLSMSLTFYCSFCTENFACFFGVTFFATNMTYWYIKAMRFGNSFGFSSNFAKMYRLLRK